MYGSQIRQLVTPKRYVDADGVEQLSEQCNCSEELLKKIVSLRQKSAYGEGEYTIVINNESKWARLFLEYIISSVHCTAKRCHAHSDDMVWVVNRLRMSGSFYVEQAQPNILQVFRRNARNMPKAGDPNINWEETVCINVIMHQLDFYVTAAICTKTSPQNLQIIKKTCQQVYPSPSRRRMDAKGESEEITYPGLYFAIDGFEELFSDIIIRDGECVCIELVVKDRQRKREAVTFLGSIRYDVLKNVYESRASSGWQSWANKLLTQGSRRREFVRMRGPNGKGVAEMAVTRARNCGYETPLMEKSVDFSDYTGVEQAMNHRRMSETNLNQPYVKTPSSSTLPAAARDRRWQSEANSVNQLPVVEGNTLDDELEEGVLSRLWGIRGFGQAFHVLREKQRAESMPLNAYLTYITLPWTSILSDLLSDNSRSPILTFEVNMDLPCPPSH